MIFHRPKHGLLCRIYVPGLISLFLFFPLGMFQLHQYGAFKKQTMLDVSWYSPQSDWPFELEYNLKFAPARHYQLIIITGNRKEDETKLDYAQLAIREIVALGDTVNGVRVHFNDTARYESFVRVLNICLEEGMVPYVPYKKDIWIFNCIGSVDEGKRPQYSFCGMHGPRTHARSEGLLAFPLHYNYDKRLWPIFLTLTILAALSLRRSLIS